MTSSGKSSRPRSMIRSRNLSPSIRYVSFPHERRASRTVSGLRDALHAALVDESSADPSVLVMGEDVGTAGGVFRRSTRGLQEPVRRSSGHRHRHLRDGDRGRRVRRRRDRFPRPVLEVMFGGDFMPLAMDLLVNQSAKYDLVSLERSARCDWSCAARWGEARGWASCTPRCRRRGSSGRSGPEDRGAEPLLPLGLRSAPRAAIRDDNPVHLSWSTRCLFTKGPAMGAGADAAGRGPRRAAPRGADVTLINRHAHHAARPPERLIGSVLSTASRSR